MASPSIRIPIRLSSNRRNNFRSKTRTRRNPASSPVSRDNPECRGNPGSPVFQDSPDPGPARIPGQPVNSSPRIPISRVNLNIRGSRDKTQGSRSNILGSLRRTAFNPDSRSIRDSRHNSQGRPHIKRGSPGLLRSRRVFLELRPWGRCPRQPSREHDPATFDHASPATFQLGFHHGKYRRHRGRRQHCRRQGDSRRQRPHEVQRVGVCLRHQEGPDRGRSRRSAQQQQVQQQMQQATTARRWIRK